MKHALSALFKKAILAILCLSPLPMVAENFKDILLIVNYNHARYQDRFLYDSIPTIKKAYEPYFPNIVFYGPEAHENVIDINHGAGYWDYVVIADAMKRFPRYKGYFFVDDDCIINPWFFDRFDKKKVWYATMSFVLGSHELGAPIHIDNDYFHWGWWMTKWGRGPIRRAYAQLPEYAKTTLEQNWGPRTVVAAFADIAYVPEKYKKQFIELSHLFGQYQGFVEIVLPTILGCLCPKDEWENLRGRQRDNNFEEFAYHLDFYHSLKLSWPEHKKFFENYFALAAEKYAASFATN